MQPGAPLPATPTPGNRTLVIALVVISAGLAVLCCAGAGLAVFLTRPRADRTVTLPEEPARVSPDASPPASSPPAPIEADRVLRGRGAKVVPLPGLSDLTHLVVMTHQGSQGFAVNALDGGGRITALLAHGYGKYQGTMLLDARERPATVQVRASGAWKLVIRDARRALLWTGKGSGKVSTVLRVEPAWTQPSATMRYTHRGTGNFAIHSYDGRWSDLLVNKIGRQDGETTIPAGTRYLEIEADGAWTFGRP